MTMLRVLLLLLPIAFRREYGAEIRTTVAAQWRAERASLRLAARVRYWRRQWIAVLRTAWPLWKDHLRTRHPSDDRRARDRLIRDRLLDDRRPGSARGPARRRVLSGAWKDVAHSARALAARPGYTVVAVLTLGLGVGATSAMFSAVHSVLLRDLPYRDAGDIVVLRQTDVRDGSFEEGVSAANLRDIAAAARTVAVASGADGIHGLRLVDDGRAVSLRSWVVSEGFFETMGARARLGRTFLAEEYLPGGETAVLLSHDTWLTRFAGDPGVVGREVVLDGVAHSVVGVMPPEFRYPSASDTWTPRPPGPRDEELRDRAIMQAVARLGPGVSLPEAQAELDRIASDLAATFPEANANLGLRAISLRDHLFGDVESPLVLLLGAVALVLLVAAANVAGLQLARGAARSREYVLRGALGAGPGRILRLVGTESLLLAGAGCALGVGLAHLGVWLIEMLGPDHLPRIDELRIDGTVLAFAVVAALASAVIAGLAPALRAARVDLNAALGEASRGSTRGAASSRLRDRLVIAEIALALVLTIGAGLLVRSFGRLLDNDLGFETENRLALQVWAYDDDHSGRFGYFEQGREEILRVPGVEAVGLTSDLPLADDRSILSIPRTVPFTLQGGPSTGPGAEPLTRWVAIDPEYHAALGIPMVAGRPFAIGDRGTSAPVALVNESFVRRYLSGREAVGARIALHLPDTPPREIVGVLADVRREGLESAPRPEVYVPLAQRPANGLTFVVRTSVDPAGLTTAIREALWAVDPGQAVWASRPLENLLSDWIRQRRFNTAVLVAFAGLALSLAGIGVYGLMSFSVAQRVDELGIRRALGGHTRDIMRLVLRRALLLGAIGVGIGLAGSVALARLLRGMLYGVAPYDPLTFASLSVLVVGVSLLAAFLPARRATRVDPMVALRQDR